MRVICASFLACRCSIIVIRSSVLFMRATLYSAPRVSKIDDSGFKLYGIRDHPRCSRTQGYDLCRKEHNQGVVLGEPRFELIYHLTAPAPAVLNMNMITAITIAMPMAISTMRRSDLIATWL